MPHCTEHALHAVHSVTSQLTAIKENGEEFVSITAIQTIWQLSNGDEEGEDEQVSESECEDNDNENDNDNDKVRQFSTWHEAVSLRIGHAAPLFSGPAVT